MKRIFVLLTIFALVISLCACGGNSNLIGHWVCPNGSPEQIVLKKDGTGSYDGVSCNWMVSDGKITFTLGIFGSETYEYQVNGKTLYLDGDAYEKN